MPLTPQETDILKQVLIEDEGLKLFPYLDCCSRVWRRCECPVKGKLTIGVGRNLDDFGILESESMFLLENNIYLITKEVERVFSTWFNKLTPARKVVIISMAFNLGMGGLKNFKNMIKQIEIGDFGSASTSMKESLWARQVGARATQLSELMRTGRF